ncbi:MAG: hypothetical protein EWM73_03461 [Nitrospira sp.]|nr:MAG: hypothetical protein EWM73_03461 [Nitrospira sp.]
MTSSNKLLRGVLMLVFGFGVTGFVGPSRAERSCQDVR